MAAFQVKGVIRMRGEVAIKSWGSTPGYGNNPEATAGVFHNGWYLT